MITELRTPIIDLEKMRLYSTEAIDHYPKLRCPGRHFHSNVFESQYACAFQNAQRLKCWFIEYWGEGTSYEKSV
ncbi:GSCOCG00012763001-RA-CDS, partial [Cotesia congregata]